MRDIHYLVIGITVYLMISGIDGLEKAEASTDWDVFAEISETYDDNILYDPDDELDDLITNTLVGVGFEQEQKTYRLNLEGSVEHNIFAEHQSFDNTSQHFDLQLGKQLSDLGDLMINNNFEHAEVPDTFEETFGRERGRYEFYKNAFELIYSQNINVWHGYNISYGNKIYDADRIDIPASMSHILGLEWNYQANPSDIYSLNYEANYTSYEDADDGNIHKLFGRWKHLYDKRTELQIDAGASFIYSFDDENSVKPFALLKLTNEIAQNTQFAVSLKKEYQPSHFRNDIFDLWQLSVDLHQQFTEKLGVEVAIFYGLGKYLNADIEDQLAGTDINLGYEIKENIKIFLRHIFAWNDSNEDLRDYDKNRVSLGIKIIF
jgi:hypothetical protein